MTSIRPAATVEAHTAAEWPRTVRTTIEPGREIVVGRREWLDLKRSGLLVDEGTGRHDTEPGPTATARAGKD